MARPLPSDPVLLAGERDRLDHPEWESGGGGLLSTITDYQRFSQMLLNGGEFEGKRYLSPAAFKAMTTDHVGPGSGVGRDYFYFPGDGFGYGYGIGVRTDPGNAKPPPAGSIGELKWDSGQRHLFRRRSQARHGLPPDAADPERAQPHHARLQGAGLRLLSRPSYAAREARWPKSASSFAISAAGRAALNRNPCTSLQPSARSQSS